MSVTRFTPRRSVGLREFMEALKRVRDKHDWRVVDGNGESAIQADDPRGSITPLTPITAVVLELTGELPPPGWHGGAWLGWTREQESSMIYAQHGWTDPSHYCVKTRARIMTALGLLKPEDTPFPYSRHVFGTIVLAPFLVGFIDPVYLLPAAMMSFMLGTFWIATMQPLPAEESRDLTTDEVRELKTEL